MLQLARATGRSRKIPSSFTLHFAALRRFHRIGPARLFVLSCLRAPPGPAFCVLSLSALRPVPVSSGRLVHVERAAADAEPASSDEAENDDEDEREEDKDAEARQHGSACHNSGLFLRDDFMATASTIESDEFLSKPPLR